MSFPQAHSLTGVYIIAELGVNHDGSVQRALELIDHAAAAGADAVKFQFFSPLALMSKASALATYQQNAGEQDPREMLARLELTPDQLAPLVTHAHNRHLAAIVTVFSDHLVPIANNIPFDAYKTASPDIIHKPLLDELLKTNKPLIISTGASTLDEVTRAYRWLSQASARLSFLQCVSSYPTPIEHAELQGIQTLRAALPVPIGYSDHTNSTHTGALAVEHGATILEKHLTYSRSAQGPDHAASLDPVQLRTYISLARAAAHVRSNTGWPTTPINLNAKRVLPIEQDVRKLSRQSIVLQHPLEPGQPITPHNITFKRPGTGIPPFMLDSVLSSIPTTHIPADIPLQPSWLTPISSPPPITSHSQTNRSAKSAQPVPQSQP